MSGKGHSVLILSSLPGEGRTTTALGLAQAAVAGGQRAVILDMDLHRSGLAAGLGLRPRADLQAYLRGAALLPEILAPSGFGFDVIASGEGGAAVREDPGGVSSGVQPGGASEHRSSIFRSAPGPAPSRTPVLPQPHVLARLIAALARRYDLVVVDTPPLLAVSDGLMLAPLVDQVVYAVRQRHTSRRAVALGLSMLHDIGITPAGMILTMAGSGTGVMSGVDPDTDRALRGTGYDHPFGA